MDKQKVFAALDEQVTAQIDLGEFHPRLEGEVMTILLNPPTTQTRRLKDIKDNEERGVQMAALQIQELTLEEVRELFSKDAPFCDWLIGRIMQLSEAYREGSRKNSATD